MIRVGLVGYGMAGQIFHAPVISAVEGLELAAVVERHTRNAEKIYPKVQTYSSLEAMLGDKSIELIAIATPNASHAPLAHEALRADRHVVVDKPMALDSEEVRGLIALASEHQRLLIPFQSRRVESDFLTLKKLLHEEKLGRVVAFESTHDRWRPKRRDRWREDGTPGGGILLDLGTHQIDQTFVLFGKPEAVNAEVLCERPGGIVNDAFTLRLHDPGLIATLTSTCLASMPRPRFLVRGTSGNYVKWGIDPQEARLRDSGPDNSMDWSIEAATSWGTLAAEKDGAIVEETVTPVASDYRSFYAQVRDAMLGNGQPPAFAIDAWRTARVIEWAEQGSRERRTIACSWADEPPYPGI